MERNRRGGVVRDDTASSPCSSAASASPDPNSDQHRDVLQIAAVREHVVEAALGEEPDATYGDIQAQALEAVWRLPSECLDRHFPGLLQDIFTNSSVGTS
jgi:hypothetical protein